MKVCQSLVGFGGSLRLFNQSSSGLMPGGLEFECDPCVRYIYIYRVSILCGHSDMYKIMIILYTYILFFFCVCIPALRYQTSHSNQHQPFVDLFVQLLINWQFKALVQYQRTLKHETPLATILAKF